MATQTASPPHTGNGRRIDIDARIEEPVSDTIRPNGPVAAALVAGGTGPASIGQRTTLAAPSTTIKNGLNWYNPVGPLTGTTLLGVILYLASWAVLHMVCRGKNVNFTRAAALGLALLGVGLITTFPPFFELIAAE
jgi:hypothetical protein